MIRILNNEEGSKNREFEDFIVAQQEEEIEVTKALPELPSEMKLKMRTSVKLYCHSDTVFLYVSCCDHNRCVCV